MPKTQAVAERFGSVKNAKAAMKKSQGNRALRRFKADETVKVRFLQEPEDWYKAYYHWLGGNFLWCNRMKSCEGCKSGDKPKMQILANAVIISSPDDREAMNVYVMQMTNSLAMTLFKFYEKRGTLLDRDYDLTREGSGMNDTVYSADPDDPKKRNLARFEDKMHDVSALIREELGEESEDDEEEDDEEPRTTKVKRRPTSRPGRRDADEDEEDDDNEDEEEEENERPRRSSSRRTVVKKKSPPKRSRHDDEDDEEEDDEEEEEDDIDYELRKEEERRARVKRANSASTKKSSKSSGLDEFKKPVKATRVVRRSR